MVKAKNKKVIRQQKRAVKEAAREIEDEKHPARKDTGRSIFNHIVVFFMVGAIFGTYWEEILWFFKELIEQGEFVWVSRTGLLYGPFSPVYGIGAVMIYLMFYLPRAKAWMCFVGGAIFGGALEYLLSWAQELVFETRSWDYSNLWLNIGGRTTVPYMVVWGALILVMAKWICPFIDQVCRKVEERYLKWFCMAMATFLVFDILVSVAAVMRQTERHEGDSADTPVEELMDEEFPDERLEEIYSNMKEVE